jgi:hypothetical protein
MRFNIIQTDLTSNEQTVVFSTEDQELMEMMFKDYVRCSTDHHAYEVIEKLSEN